MLENNPKKARNQKRPITKELIIEIALRRYSDGQIRSLDELAIIFGREKSVISRCITAAHERNLIEIRPTAVLEVNRVESLERRLLSQYSGLRNAIVVASESEISGDVVHSDLGQGAARWLLPMIVLDHDILGIGSGRGVYHFIEAIRNSPKLRATDVTLTSLSGALLPGHDKASRNSCLDSDTNIAMLGPGFEHPVKYRPVAHPLIDANPKDRQQHWENQSISQAWLGLGLLSAKGHPFRPHRLIEVASDGGAPGAPSEYLAETLRKIDAALNSLNGVGWGVAELAHRFFVVNPPGSTKVAAAEELYAAVEELNDQLFNPPEKLLRSAHRIVLLAGTVRKARAIHQTLEAQRYPIQILVTDEITARAIIAGR